MKKDTLWGILGLGVVISAIALWLKNKKEGSENEVNIERPNAKEKSETFEEKSPEEDLTSSQETQEETMENLGGIKAETSSVISDRHEEASEMIKEIVKNLNDDTEVEAIHKEEYDNMLNDLDMLL